jgi:quercetin dioxygenase-like cupin family protein
MNEVPIRSIGRVASWSREDSALDPSVRRRLFAANRTMILVCGLRPGVTVPAHVHRFEQVTTVVHGRIAIHLDGRERTLEAGRSVIVPAGTPHTCRALDPDGAEVFHVYPAGADPSPYLG